MTKMQQPILFAIDLLASRESGHASKRIGKLHGTIQVEAGRGLRPQCDHNYLGHN